jgi:hypothetical protein
MVFYEVSVSQTKLQEVDKGEKKEAFYLQTLPFVFQRKIFPEGSGGRVNAKNISISSYKFARWNVMRFKIPHNLAQL